MYQLSVYVPASHLEVVKTGLFEAGAGRLGNYDACAWEVEGMGQFRPLKGSQAFIGKIDRVEHVKEYKVEVICEDACIRDVLKKMMDVHPYETPAYYVCEVKTLEDFVA